MTTADACAAPDAAQLAAKSEFRLCHVNAPVISVIVPVYNQWPVTARCLESLFACDPGVALHLIVVDDASTDETPAALSRLPGIDVVRNGRNLGFLRSCNRGAKLAIAPYVYFLNNDTELRSGALHSLVNRIRSSSDIGIVGSKLVYPDGRLQEAGGIIWSDASGWNYGRFDVPDKAEYASTRDVDYVSGASLLISASLLKEIGGFDERFSPAYYEDVDLCFAARARNKRVVYEPNSVVIHFEGISSGTDLTSGAKRFQVINQSKFRAKWAPTLDADHFAPDAAHVPRAARRRDGHVRSILVIDSYVPLHDREAGSNRLQHLIDGFLASGTRVAFYPENCGAIEPYTSALQRSGVEVYVHSPGDSRDWKALLIDALATVDAVWLCRPHLFSRYFPIIRAHSSVPVLYDTIDLHHLRMQREAIHHGRSDDTAWQQMRDLELTCATAADTTVVTARSEALFLDALGIGPVAVVPTIHDREGAGVDGFDQTSGLIFIGGYNHTPNVDAALWLAREIMPRVWRDLPTIKLTLLGSNPPEDVRALESDTIAVPGFIADVSAYFRSSRVFVAPIRYGAGINGKIGHALAFSMPIVTTSIGAGGFGLKHGISAMVADDADGFAEAIVALYRDEVLWNTISMNGAVCLEPFSSHNIVRAALDAVEQACSESSD